MDNISMIACVGKNLELGKNNDLIWHLPNDLKYFKKVTSGKTVIMGRRTFDSLPGVLPKRRNIVLQLPNESKIDGVEIFNSIPEILDNIKDEEEVFIIGGASIYRQTLPYVDEVYLTKVNADGGAEVFFVNLDEEKDFELVKESEPEMDGDLEIKFTVYRNNNKKEIA